MIRPGELPDGTVLVIGTIERNVPALGPVTVVSVELFTAPGPACYEVMFGSAGPSAVPSAGLQTPSAGPIQDDSPTP